MPRIPNLEPISSESGVRRASVSPQNGVKNTNECCAFAVKGHTTAAITIQSRATRAEVPFFEDTGMSPVPWGFLGTRHFPKRPDCHSSLLPPLGRDAINQPPHNPQTHTHTFTHCTTARQTRPCQGTRKGTRRETECSGDSPKLYGVVGGGGLARSLGARGKVTLMVNTSLLAGAPLKCDAGSVVMSFLDKMTTRNPAMGNTSPMLPVRLVLPPASQA
ncbi:unnamed protein product [Leuciscus chuanchicus]